MMIEGGPGIYRIPAPFPNPPEGSGPRVLTSMGNNPRVEHLGGVVGPHVIPSIGTPVRRGFLLAAGDIPASAPDVLLSILIPTLDSRRGMLEALVFKLTGQIARVGEPPPVEIIIYSDERQRPVGEKRNRLLEEARGRFVVFVDDDDDVMDDYVQQIVNVIRRDPDLDCIGMRAIITFMGRDPRQVVYSLRFRQPSNVNGVYCRPIQHLTPVRREIAARYLFPEINFGEDTAWSEALYADPRLKREHFIDKVLYHYRYNPQQTETQRPVGAIPVPEPLKQMFHVVIPSARADYLVPCVRSILENEPLLPAERIVVVDDGARESAEVELPGVTWVAGAKPFVFARNVNLGIQACLGDVIVMNDDARLVTKFGFTSLHYAARGRPDVGLCSSGVKGIVGNPNQVPRELEGIHPEPRTLAFICVYIPRETLLRVGALDERFTGYGFEDNDYCLRVRKEGLSLGIYDGCVVEHGEDWKKSTFRSKPDINELFARNREAYVQKWGQTDP
jgi:GT2 family glycosyltransferase